MEIRSREDGALCRAELLGELDIYAAGELRTALLDLLRAHPALELDLSEVEALDTAGLQVLMSAKAMAASLGHELALSRHSRPVLDVLELCRLQAYFGDPVVETTSRRQENA